MLQRNIELPSFCQQRKDKSTSANQLIFLDTTNKRRRLARPATERKLTPASIQKSPEERSKAAETKRCIEETPFEISHSHDSSLPALSPQDKLNPIELDNVLRIQHQQDQRLRQVERKLRSSLNLATVLGTTVVETAAFLQAKQVSLLRHDPALQRWQPVAQYCGNQTLAWQQPFAFHQNEFPTLLAALQQGYPIYLNGSMGEAESAEAARWRSRWLGNWILIPIKCRQRISYSLSHAAGSALSAQDSDWSSQDHWGIMALAIAEDQIWPDTAAVLGQSIVGELEWAIAQATQHQELLQANQELQKLALSDGLTRLANRRRFDEHLSDEWQRLARDKQPLSLILCDLDHFKRYNDTFGHPAGDRCLIRVARALLNGPQRPADLVARYGGEEFAVILPNTDTHGAWRIAQKIHDNIRALEIEHAPSNEEKYVTVTMGVSTVLPGHSSSPQMLIQASDLALYHAKQQGRNRTYVHAHYNTVETDTAPNNEPLDMTPQ